MKYILLFVIVFITHAGFAQDGVVVYKDPRIDALIAKQKEVNDVSTKNATGRRTAKGYRLLVISTNSRDEAIAAKTTLYNYFPELKPYMWHQSPFYKVKAGNFTSRNDAAAYQKRLASYFPKGVFVMNDIVEVKPGEVSED